MIAAEAAILALLRQRGPDKSICPSEAAREIASPDADWRAKMDEVHAATRNLLQCGDIALSWQGRVKAAPDGPYRIRLKL